MARACAIVGLDERVMQQMAEAGEVPGAIKHTSGELAEAGGCYLLYADADRGLKAPVDWPWGDEWWKLDSFRRNLVKGCALGFAEGEKFDRSRNRKAAS